MTIDRYRVPVPVDRAREPGLELDLSSEMILANTSCRQLLRASPDLGGSIAVSSGRITRGAIALAIRMATPLVLIVSHSAPSLGKRRVLQRSILESVLRVSASPDRRSD